MKAKGLYFNDSKQNKKEKNGGCGVAYNALNMNPSRFDTIFD